MRSIVRQIHDYVSNGHGVTDTPFIIFGQSGQATVGVYIGQGLLTQGFAPALKVFEDNFADLNVSTPSLAMQFCGPEYDGSHIFGIMVTSNAKFALIQNAIQAWNNGTCLSYAELTSLTGQATFAKSLTPVSFLNGTAKSPKSLNTTSLEAYKRNGGKTSYHTTLGRRPECKAVEIEPGDSCEALTERCGISPADFTNYNPEEDFCATLMPKQHACYSSGYIPEVSPGPDGDVSSAVNHTKSEDDPKTDDTSTGNWINYDCTNIFIADQTCYQSGNSRVPYLERRQVERNSRGGPKSWIYRHGWAVWHRKYKKNYWLCRYCHQRRKQEACYEADSTTNAGRHLSSNKPGHSHGPNGPVPIASREGNIMGALAKSQVYIMRSKGIEVSQEVANEIAASFSTSRFQDALKDWVVADNQSLRVIETPQFRAMIAAYNTYILAVANYLREARSLIHVSFDNWTSTGGHEGKLVDHLLGLPELHGAHTGNNIAAAATTILRLFGVDNARVGYFVLDNASNNDTAVESLAEEFGFIASERRLRCCCHILNLSAQLVIWGKDRSAYENEAAHLEEEEKYMDEWRKYGPVGVLFDVIASICTPQTRQLLERLQCEEAESLGVTPHIRQLVKPVKTRWNSYFNTFVRAAELHGPIDGYIECKLEEHSAATATSRRRKNHRLKDVNYEDLDAPEDHLITNVNLAHCKLAKYYAKFDNAPVYYTATILHPHYKHHLSALWKVPDTHVTARDGVHYRDGWLDNNHRAFLRMWQGRKDSAATSAHTVTPPRKKPRLGISTSRSAFLQSSIEQSTRQLEASLAEDEYEIWKRQPALAEEDWLSLNPLLYWESVAGQFLYSQTAAADCERTFSELGDMLGTRRLHMKPELISALQSLKSWKRLENKFAPIPEETDDKQLLLVIDLLTLGTLSVAGPFFNNLLKTLPYFIRASDAAFDNAKEATVNLIGQSTTIAKDLKPDQSNSRWTPEKQASFSNAMGQTIDGWANITGFAVHDLFDGTDASTDILWNAISDGKLIEGKSEGNTPQDTGEADLRAHIGKTIFQYSIPQLWRISNTYPFVIDSGYGCGEDKPLRKYLSDITMEATGACIEDTMYYLVEPHGQSRDCPCATITDFPSKWDCREEKFSALSGLSLLDGNIFAGVTKEDLINGSVRTWKQNGKVNGGGLPDVKDKLTIDDLLSMDVTTPRYVRLPVCIPAQAFQSWDSSKPGSSDNYPCDNPPGINSCGDSTFEDQSSDASSNVADCLEIIENIEGDASTTWTTQVIGKNQRKIASFGSCSFGVEATEQNGNTDFAV
ncbi:Hce2 domain containing protein [Pyrenophora tritici-repentis]|nr:Hce2 domain containing protein [Pyrenophora tritici-repentis]